MRCAINQTQHMATKSNYLSLGGTVMEIMWEHIFDLVERMWELNQNGIANCLGVDRSTISRLKNGKQLQFNYPCNKVYRNLFDPTNPQIPAFGKDSKELLRDLKNEIEEAGLTDGTKDLEDDNYEKFVIGLLRLAKGNQAKLVTRRESVPDVVHENESNDQETNETQPERMLDIFVQGCDNFAVEGFIDRDPTTDRISDMFRFIWLIRKQDKKDNLDKNEESYNSINRFIDILQEYLNFLKRSSGNLDSFPDNYKLPNRDSKEFSEESNRYREQLNSLYLQIKAEVEKMELKCQEQRRAAGKEAWNTSKQIKDFLND